MKNTLVTVLLTLSAVVLGLLTLFCLIGTIVSEGDARTTAIVFFVICFTALIFCILTLKKSSAKKIKNPENITAPRVIDITQSETSSDKRKSVIEPIDGFTLKYHYKDVEITSWDYIPQDVKIGNRVVLIQEPTNEADDKAVLLMFVPQRKKFGYLYRGKLQDMANDYLDRGDKIIARLSYLQFKPYKVVKIDIAFFQKNN